MTEGDRSERSAGAAGRTGPLVTERVLDLSTTVAGAYCAKLLGDLGADVVKVEQPGGGDPLRRQPPFAGERPDPETNPQFLYFNTSKRSVTLDITTSPDRDLVRRLVERYDVVVADGPEPALHELGLGHATLRSWNPAVILTTISGFGSSGPYARYGSTHLVTCALGGWADGCRTPGRRPLQAAGSLTATVSGGYAAVATLAAIEGRARDGTGDHVDISEWEAAVTCALGPTLMYEYRNELGPRRSDHMTGPSFNVRCKDGYVGVNVLTEAQWEVLCAFVGRPDLAEDERFVDYFGRAKHAEEIGCVLEAALQDRSVEEIFHEAQLWRLPFGMVLSPRQALDLEVHRSRAYFDQHEHPRAGTLLTPRVPFVMSASPARARRAPLLGEHNDEVLIGGPGMEQASPGGAAPVGDRSTPAATAEPARPRAGSGRAGDDRQPPLSGVRIVDLTMFMSGPLTTLLAADLGAEVIKVESIQRVDGWRGPGRGGERPWENSALWNWINRSKQDVTLNLNDERGAQLLTRLAGISDVVIENYTPRVMENFGLGYDVLRAVNPGLIMLSMPGFGGTGPWRDYAAFAWTTEQLSTICHLTGYEDSGPLFTGTTGGDPLAGVMGGLALVAALNHRRRTGEGQHIDLSQVETATSFVGEALLQAQLLGEDPGRRGNRNPAMAPHNTYPCRDERWIAIACRSDAEWEALWGLVRPDATTVPHASLDERRAHLTDVDDLLTTWTSERDAAALMHVLQQAGIPAGLVMNGPDLLHDPHLRHRGFFLRQDRAEVGVKHYPGQPFRFAAGQLAAPRRAPYLGESNRAVLCDLLGVSDAEYAELERDRVVGDVPISW